MSRLNSICVQLFVFLHISTSVQSTSIKSLLQYDKITNIHDIIDKYDYFIIDQWGVLHNGKKPYEGVLECLEILKQKNKIMILLSNSSKRKTSSFKGLTKVGIDPLYFHDIVTSGELGHNLLKTKEYYKDISKYFVIGNNDDDVEYINSADCSSTSITEAQAVLARGTFSILAGNDVTSSSSNTANSKSSLLSNNIISYTKATELLASIDPWLQQCIDRNLPMLVTNPDFHRPGTNDPMPGLIGQKYELLGGNVTYIGKPYENVYSQCIELIQKLHNQRQQVTTTTKISTTTASSTLPSELPRICCIGDSLDHDILGARNLDLASVWIINGVHCNDMGFYPVVYEGSNHMPEEKVMNALFEKLNIVPDYVIPSFR